jgi:hypothetical protein
MLACGVPTCNVIGLWYWSESKSLDIELLMTGASTFFVTLHPDEYRHNASGTIDQWWNGTGVIRMAAEVARTWTGTYMITVI